MGISGGNRLMAFTRVIRTICGNTADVLIGWDLIREFGRHGSLPDVAAGDFYCPNPGVSSSMPMCILRQMRRLEPPCLRAFHSPSPSAFSDGGKEC
jgi:hypothetical protein